MLAMRALAALLLATQSSAIIYTYRNVVLPAESVLVSTHGLFGAAHGDSAFVNVDLRFQIHSPDGYLSNAEELQVFLIKHGRRTVQEYYSCDRSTGSVKIKHGAQPVSDTDGQLKPVVRLQKHYLNKCEALSQSAIHSLSQKILSLLRRICPLPYQG